MIRESCSRSNDMRRGLGAFFSLLLIVAGSASCRRDGSPGETSRGEEMASPIARPGKSEAPVVAVAKRFEEVAPALAKEKKCLSCHEGVERVNAKMDAAWKAQKVDARGVDACELCHLGNPEAYRKAEAHEGMVVNPADLRVADRICGQCHSDRGRRMQVVVNGERNHVSRVMKSLMATSAGELSGTRYLWADQAKKGAIYGNRAVKDEDGHVPAELGALAELKALPAASNSSSDHLARNFCIRCHLWSEGRQVKGDMHGGGCSACHVLYSDAGLSESGDPTLDKAQKGRARKHEITVKIPPEQCRHCHNNGGGRIGMSFTGLMWNAQAYPLKEDGSDADKPFGVGILHVQQDVHYQRGMVCIDCHSSKDLHGDGNIYSKKEEQVALQCETCHGRPDAAATLVDDRGEKHGNLQRVGRDIMLTSKIDGRRRLVPDIARLKAADQLSVAMTIPAHLKEQKGRVRLECYACHARQAPQCYGCHMLRDDRKEAPVDWNAGIGEGQPAQKAQGAWSSNMPSYMRWESPVLGVNFRGRVAPHEVGCQPFYTHIDAEGKTKALNKTFTTAAGLSSLAHNAVNPHSTSRQARECEDCHNNPKAQGLGDGILDPVAQGWGIDFSLERIVNELGQPLQDNSHEGARPFNQAELDRIDRVNVCISCHQNMGDDVTWKTVTDINGFAKTNELHKEILARIFKKGALRPDPAVPGTARPAAPAVR
ncbi:MAG: multiheme c-type cytochrome [Thermoanaerobaculia bacterium]